MYQGFAARTLGAQISAEVYQDRFGPASWPLSLMTVPDTDLVARTAFVSFPVVLPGEEGSVIPFGRYELVFSPGQTLSIAWATGVHAALLARNGGEPIPLSAEQLDAFTQDPDVEII